MSDKDDVRDLVKVFLDAREEDPEHTGQVSVGVYDKNGSLLLYRR